MDRQLAVPDNNNDSLLCGRFVVLLKRFCLNESLELVHPFIQIYAAAFKPINFCMVYLLTVVGLSLHGVRKPAFVDISNQDGDPGR